PRRPPSPCRLAHHRRRLQLPRADRPGHRPPRPAPRRSPPDGAAVAGRHPRTGSRSLLRIGPGPPARSRDPLLDDPRSLGSGGRRSGHIPALGIHQKTLIINDLSVLPAVHRTNDLWPDSPLSGTIGV